VLGRRRRHCIVDITTIGTGTRIPLLVISIENQERKDQEDQDQSRKHRLSHYVHPLETELTGFHNFKLKAAGYMSSIKSHLQDLAKRHPELADQLGSGPWCAEFPPLSSTTGDPSKNAVPMVAVSDDAPESTGSKRFTSRIEITPFDPSASASASEPAAMTGTQPRVRQIPIHVEGRSAPVMAKDTSQVQLSPSPSVSQTPSQVKPPTTGHSQQPATTTQEPPSPAIQAQPTPAAVDPSSVALERIADVEKDVEQLRQLVDAFDGQDGRMGKQYVFLDEMLTRNLIKLDLVEVDGHEQVRSSRKMAIGNIQRCISLLESKIPDQLLKQPQEATDHEMSPPAPPSTSESS